MVLHHHVLALDVASFVEALAERSGIARGGISRPTADKADERHRWLLRARRDRPRDSRTADQRDERAAFHVCTTWGGNAGLESIPAQGGGSCAPRTSYAPRQQKPRVAMLCQTHRG